MAKKPRNSQPEETKAPRSGKGRKNGATNISSAASGSVVNGTLEDEVLDRVRNYVPLTEPAATALAMQESPEGEALYRDLKGMEMEAMADPDPEDAGLLDLPPEDEIEALPIAPPVRNHSRKQNPGDDQDEVVPVPVRPTGRRTASFSLDDDEEPEYDEDGRPIIDLDHLASVDPGFVTDPVRLYLREISHAPLDRKSTRLNSSHLVISYAVF